jgi:hypothetical protein
MSNARYANCRTQHRQSRVAKSDDDVSFQRDVREKRQKNWRVQVIPLRHAGPRLTNTLHAPRR